MRGETRPEDKIVGVVLARLKNELGFSFEEMSDFTGIPASTLSGIAHSLFALGNPGRIPVIAKYFQQIHKLDYVDEKYLLNGGTCDQERIELIRQQAIIEAQMSAEERERKTRPPFLELAI